MSVPLGNIRGQGWANRCEEAPDKQILAFAGKGINVSVHSAPHREPMFAIPSSYSLRVNIPSLGETAANIQVAFDLCGAVNVSIQTGRESKVRIPILIAASVARQRRCGRDDEAQASFGGKKIQINLISVPPGSLPRV